MTCNTPNRPNGTYDEDITMNDNRPLRDSSALVSTDHATSQSEAQAARAVFDTPELLEQILKHLSIESLTPALRVSKYCRQVILGSTQLRRTMFLEPAPATEYCIWQGSDYRCSDWRTVRDPIEESSIVIKRHPLLESLDYKSYKLASYVISDREVEAAPADALLFQLPPPSVNISYCDHEMSITRAQGLTFGAVVAELDALRERC